MSNNNFEIHHNKDLFLSAIEFTAAKTGFQPTLIEKDYYCSLILHDFSSKIGDTLIFKGGTLLAKAHAGFYRLSEDLDFSISISHKSTRKDRSQLANKVKPFVNTISDRLPILNIKKELTGSDESRQYNAEINYLSCLSKTEGRILIEIGLREEVQLPSSNEKINTLILNPFTKKQYIPVFNFKSLDKKEAYAEKIRAALTRKKVAIRDFYDLDYAMKNKFIDISEKDFINLIKKKLYPGATIIKFDTELLSLLRSKIATELMPTLANQNIKFDLDNIIVLLQEFTVNLSD